MAVPSRPCVWTKTMMTLYGYWRSSASYRVRIALAIKGLEARHIPVNLRASEQSHEAHLARNPQGFVPVLDLGDGVQLRQSLAIIEYMDTAYPEPALMPKDPIARAKLMAAALVICADTAPIQNLSVLNHIRSAHSANDAQVKDWVAHWIIQGFTALEQIAQDERANGYTGPFLMTKAPSLFECCLIPQVYNARRFGVDMSAYPALESINASCTRLPAFISAHPDQQSDAPKA